MINKRLLRWMTIILPVGFVVLLLLIIDILFPQRTSLSALTFGLALVAFGTSIFSAWVFQIIDQREAESVRHSNQLEALNSAALALTTELELPIVLQKVVDLSRALVSAQYGALGVLDSDGQRFEQFITSGIENEKRETIGSPPLGHGIFSVLIEDGRSLRISDVSKHHRAVGFPKNHPSMTTLLGLPIISKGLIIGDLYVANKLASGGKSNREVVIPFDDDDQKILEMFSTQAAIAIENAKLYRQVQQLAVLEERERFGMDLHDGIIQSIYAVGLMLDDVQRKMGADVDMEKSRIGDAIQSLNQVIRDLRNYILHLRPQHFQGRDILQGVEELARALRANTFIETHIERDGVNPSRISADQTFEILHIVQEALANIQKHARATNVEIQMKIIDDRVLELTIANDGIPFDRESGRIATGNGLRNMRERARALGGEVHVVPGSEGGTCVTLMVPLAREGGG